MPIAMQSPSFLSAFSDCILDNVVGYCDIGLVQYDAATFKLRAQKTHLSHSTLSTQKKLYQQLQPQKCPIVQCHALLTGKQVLAYPLHDTTTATGPSGMFDLRQDSTSQVRMASYDLSCSFASSSPYRYALIFSRRLNLQPDSFLESVLGHQPSLQWLTTSDSSETLVILFNQKSKRKLWKRCLKDIFGYSAVPTHKFLDLQRGRRNSLDSNISLSSVSGNNRGMAADVRPSRWERPSDHIRSKSAGSTSGTSGTLPLPGSANDKIPPVPPLPEKFAPLIPARSVSRNRLSTFTYNTENSIPSTSDKFRLVYYNNNNKHVHSPTQPLELDEFLRDALKEHSDQAPHAWKLILNAKNKHVQNLPQLPSSSPSPTPLKNETLHARPDARQQKNGQRTPATADAVRKSGQLRGSFRTHQRTQSEPVALVARQSRTVSELPSMYPLDQAQQHATAGNSGGNKTKSPGTGKKTAKKDHARHSSLTTAPPARFFAANVTPPLERKPPSPTTPVPPTPNSSASSPRKPHKKTSRFAGVLGHHRSARDDDDDSSGDEKLSNLSVATTPLSLKAPPTPDFSTLLSSPNSSSHSHCTYSPSSASLSTFSPTLVTPPTPSSSTFYSNNTSTNTFATLDSWLTCNSLPSLVSDHTLVSSTSSLGVSGSSTSASSNSSSEGGDESFPNPPHLGGSIQRWHALSPPTSPSPPKYRLPEIPEIPERA